MECTSLLTVKELHAHSCDACANADYFFISGLSSLSADICKETKETLIYVAGFLCKKYPAVVGDDTAREYEDHKAYLDALNRGMLTVLSDCVVYLLYYMYVSFMLL
jgi:hypothetical protein